MRKTSQDGGDSSSITSGIENELKRSAAGIVKSKKNSIKRKVQSLSHESDDGVIEPLLQKEKDKSETLTQSAKYLVSRTKTDIKNDKTGDKDKLLSQEIREKSTLPSFSGIAENVTYANYKSNGLETTVVHNHTNVNIFSSSDGLKNMITPKTHILVEIDGSRSSAYSSSPLIFTTAKIHSNGKTTHMEPLQVTPVPILSTVEGSCIKTSSLDEKGIGTLTVQNDITKSDISDTKLCGNDLKEFSTTSVVRSENSCDINEITRDSKIADISTENTVTQSKLFEIKEPKAEQHSKEKRSITSIKIDENKNFESDSRDSKQLDNVKNQPEDKNSKIDKGTSFRQICRQKNAPDDFDDILKEKSPNITSKINKVVDKTSTPVSIIDKHVAEINLPGKSYQNFTVSTSMATVPSVSNSKASKLSTIQCYDSSMGTTIASNILGNHSDKVTTSTAAIIRTISNAKNSNETLPTNSYVTIPVTQSKIPKGILVPGSETIGKTKPVSTNLLQNDNANEMKTKPTSSIVTVVKKSIPTVTTSSKVTKPSVLTSSNKVNIASSSVSRSISSPITSNKNVLNNDIKTNASSSLPSGSNTNKTTSVLSQPVSSASPSIKPVTTKTTKFNETTIGSQISATTIKPTITMNKPTADGLNQHLSGATKIVSGREATVTKEARRIKSPITTTGSSSTQKPSDSHNKNQIK